MNGAATALRDDFLRLYPTDAAEVLESRPPTDISEILTGATPVVAAPVLQAMGAEMASRALASLPDDVFPAIVRELDVTEAAILLARLGEDERERRLTLLDGRTAREVAELLSHPPGTAGSLMDPRTTTFRPDVTVQYALSRLRTLQAEEFDDLFLTDVERRFVGTVTLERLALADPTRTLGDLAAPGGMAIHATAPVDEVLQIASGRTDPVPVVDVDGRLLGLIRPRDLVAAVEERVSGDLQTMVGVSADERALSPPAFSVRRRLPWLFINLLTAFTAASVVGIFESTIARVSALAVLMPVVAGQSGNSGAQALAVAMRGLALREIRASHWRRLVLKEAAVGLANGVVIALATGVAVAAWSRSLPLGAVIAVAMVISMTVAGMAGAAIPLVLQASGQDPAQSSSIVLTTVTDVVGFLTFLGLATLLAAQL